MSGRVFTKLLLLFVLVLLLGTVILDVSLRQLVERSLHGQAERDLTAKARLVAGQLNPGNTETLSKQVQQQADAAGSQVTVLDRQGKVLAHSAGGDAAAPDIERQIAGNRGNPEGEAERTSGA